jgi:tetratricopeptide (TPR) repeat protein
MRRALLALHSGDAAAALPLLEQASTLPEARYTWLELGRARILCGDSKGGQQALEQFLASLAQGEGGDARLGAHLELAALAHEANDVEGAIAQHQAALEALPDDPRPYIALARFLRRVEMPEEALEVLQSATDALESESPQLPILIEQGLAHAQLNADKEAIDALEQAVSLLTARQHLDLPPELATKLAELHERTGNRARALDLYALLAQGSDVAQHASYHQHSGRLLAALGHASEARRAYQRALALSLEGSPEHTAISTALAAIG